MEVWLGSWAAVAAAAAAAVGVVALAGVLDQCTVREHLLAAWSLRCARR